MTKEELNRVLDLQSRAFGLLLWMNEQEHQNLGLWDEENLAAWRFTELCEARLRHRIDVLPRDLCPEDGDISTLSHFMSSFFNPSQSVGLGKWKFIALEELAIENDVNLSRTQLETLANDSSLLVLALCYYMHKVLRHAQFVCQGAVVDVLWQTLDMETRQTHNAAILKNAWENAIELRSLGYEVLHRSRLASQNAEVQASWQTFDEKSRQKMDTEIIWQARETLLAAMRDAAK